MSSAAEIVVVRDVEGREGTQSTLAEAGRLMIKTDYHVQLYATLMNPVTLSLVLISSLMTLRHQRCDELHTVNKQSV